MKGFKSFARETIINFDRHAIVIVGPNGSGKSNITDALCFVLGRLSIKSIRAAKAAHLIFSGNKNFKPSNHAYVEITFDNEKGTFAVNEKEIIIRREIKRNGLSVYKINNQTKTRQEVLELLSQAGIDPYGFNIILQGEIERFVKMHSEERRKIIEEVSGISVYEIRKEKSLNELEKTEEKLRQINAILRERTAYLKNLENERIEALRFKALEQAVKKFKFSIIKKNFLEKEQAVKEIFKRIELKNKEIEKIELQLNKTQGEINNLSEKVNEISEKIQTSSGVEQDTLFEEISSLRQDIAGLTARKENFENQILELDRRKNILEQSIKLTEEEIGQMIKEKGKNKKQELEKKKVKLEEYEELKRKYYLLKSNLTAINEQLEDKKTQLQNLRNESNVILNKIQEVEKEINNSIKNINENKKIIEELKKSINKNSEILVKNEITLLEKEKIFAIENEKIKEYENIKKQVESLDICPLCKTKITKDHIQEVISYSNKNIENSKLMLNKTAGEIKNIKTNNEKFKLQIDDNEKEINLREIMAIKLQTIDEKKSYLKENNEKIKNLEIEIKNLENRKLAINKKISITKISDEQYETLKLEVNELLRSEERDLGAEIVLKQRELERIKLAIKQNIRDKEEILEELDHINNELEEKQAILEQKHEKEEEVKIKYQKLFENKNLLQDKIRNLETGVFKFQNEKRFIENEKNNLNIEKAQISAKKDTLNDELKEFGNIQYVNLPVEKLKEKLQICENKLARIGSVNLRALEVFDRVKSEYEKIKEKIEQLEKEKQEIIKIIEQIDRKKKKTFLQTLSQINEKFSRNFSQLITKGIVTLEPQDKKEIFNAGLDVIVKVGQGKYFDVTSLSGGEQTLVALSLIFAIQELNPYHFYIFDEIDAALDRRNSEKLAYLLKKHMKQGQYLIITHNDSIISESSNVLYGVSMQEGISKILSLEV